MIAAALVLAVLAMVLLVAAMLAGLAGSLFTLGAYLFAGSIATAGLSLVFLLGGWYG